MSLPRLITAASALPVSLAELKAHLHIDASYTAEDTDLMIKLNVACGSIEAEIGYPMVHSTWDWHTASWPSVLPHHQVSAVASIKATDSAGNESTVSSAVYSVVSLYDEAVPTQYAGEARIELAYGQTWPSLTLATGEPIVTRITSGWKDAAAVPYQLKAAVLLEAGHLYKNREAVTLGNTAIESRELARGVDTLIGPYKRWRF